MGYSLVVVEVGRKLVAQGKTLQEVRTATGKDVSLKTYEQWREKAREDVAQIDDMVAIINQQFGRKAAIAVERQRLHEEESKIDAFLHALNVTAPVSVSASETPATA